MIKNVHRPPAKRPRNRTTFRSSKPQKTRSIFLRYWHWTGVVAACLFLGWFINSPLSGKVWLRSTDILIKSSVPLGFSAKTIHIEGDHQTSQEEILSTINLRMGQPILYFNPKRAKENLEALPWVRTASVQRQFPHTIRIHLFEKRPVALWQKNSVLHLIDETGEVIQGQDAKKFSYLLVVVGRGAPKRVPQLILSLKNIPSLYERVTAAIFVSDRRWDLILNNKINIKLPEKKIDQALEYLVSLEKENKLDHRQVVSVDLRDAERSYFYLTPSAAARYAKGKRKQV